MIPCKLCHTINSLDSSFCKHCGTPLTQEDLQEAKSILGKRVSQGFVLFNENRVDEAYAIGEQAVKDDPTSAEAFSLLAMCQERRGRLAEALENYEKVVELNPDSSLDRVKVVFLRNEIAKSGYEPAEPNRKVALTVAVAAGLCVLLLGSGWAVMLSRQKEASQVQTVAEKTDSQYMAPFPEKPAPVTPTNQGSAKQEPETKPDVTKADAPANEKPAAAAPSTTASPQPAQRVTPGPTPSPGGNGILPEPVASTNTAPSADGELQPLRINLQPANKLGKNAQVSLDPDPKPQAQPTEDIQQATDSSVVEINLSQPKRAAIGGAQAATDSNGAQSLQRAASSQFQAKRYDAAARSYEKLLKSGGDPALVNQRLGQCYENLGRKVDASIAYQRAIVALENNLNAGRGNSGRQKLALEACRQALKVLKGS